MLDCQPNSDTKKPAKSDAENYLQKDSVVGTPDYMAPEMINKESFRSEGMDWWAVGIIIYEFFVGIPPFNDDTIHQIHTNILGLNMDWPPIGYEEGQISPEAKDLIQKLLVVDVSQRLGYNTGYKEIIAHPFFSGFNWNDLGGQTPPLLPGIGGHGEGTDGSCDRVINLEDL
jgi:serine/threonine protein kinase